MKKSAAVFKLLILALLFLSEQAAACPMCNDLIERGKDALGAMKFGGGIAWSMLLMFAVPVLLISGFSFVLMRSCKKAQKQRQLHDAN